jgi:WD40 repeat protein
MSYHLAPIALTQNGQRVAFVGESEIILSFDMLDMNNVDLQLQDPLVLAGHSGSVTDMAFSRNGLLLATISADCTLRIWDIQAAAERKHRLIKSASDNLEVIANWDEAFIDNDGWLRYYSIDSPLRLIWIPELHRKSLHRPSNVRVLGQEGRETRLDLERFYAHGRDWIRCCKASSGGILTKDTYNM